MRHRYALALALMVAAPPAMAQAPQPAPLPDPRIVREQLAAQAAELKLQEALLRAITQDAQRREQQWAEYSRSLWAAPEPAKPDAPKP